MSVRLAPQHCPADHDLLVHPDEQPPCSALHSERTTRIVAAGTWLERAAAALADGSVSAACCPHPDGSGRALSFTGIDPQCLAVVLAQGRIGRFDADVAYIGLCAQQPSGRWQGLAGVFVWLCSACPDGGAPLGPRQLQALLARSVPDLTQWDVVEIPTELAWGPGWWDERWIATYGLDTSVNDLWTEMPLGQALAPLAPLAPDQVVLLRLGEEWNDASTLVLATASAAEALRSGLEPEYGDAPLRARRGVASQLLRLPGSGSPTAAVRHRLGVRQGPPPVGPVLLRLRTAADRSPLVRFTHQPRRLAHRLAEQGVVARETALALWSLPRRTPNGVIDGDLLVALHRRLTTTDPS